ncbi:hypothetical protein ACFRFQ_03350 [Rhodococcus sp. NPDC056743]|uniref:hypothetical protein n=1 Tax=Rhodococcus sp. NPDC056743 TaxID=3345934 RepID=UPI00366ED56D
MAEDSQQISVAELLKRNGQTVESRGGRRRRGVAGGISVAELTGEIPIVRPAGSRSAAESDAPPEAPETQPDEIKPDEPKSAQPSPAPVTDAKPPVTSDESDDTRIDLHKPISKNAPGQWVSRAPVTPKKAVPLAPTQAVPVVPAPTQAVPVVPAPTPARKSVPAGPPKVTQEPALLSGQTLAGDLMRQKREADQNPSMRGPILPPRVAPSSADADASDADVSTEMMDSISDDPAEPAAVNKTGSSESATAAPEREPAASEEIASTEPAAAEDTGDRNSIREWAILAGQVVVALIIGGAMFKGFEKLWDMLPWVALVLALIVIVGLVAVVRVLRKTDDITSFVIAVVVGMIVTLGPLAFLLTSG